MPISALSPSALLSILHPHMTTFDHPGPGPYQGISLAGTAEAAVFWQVPAREAMARCLDAGIWPLRFKANRGLLSAEEQALLLRRHVAVIGCGGLGGHLITLLARMGIGALTVCDCDSFDESNLNRQLLCREDRLGMNKALAAKEELARIASHVAVRAVTSAATANNLPDVLASVHAVVDCLDSIPTRLALEQAAATTAIPCIHGALAGMEGFALVVRPGTRLLTRLYGAQAAPEHGGVTAAHTAAGLSSADKASPRGAEKHAGTPTPIPAGVAVLQAVLTGRILLAHTQESVGPTSAKSAPGMTSALWHLDLSAPSLELLRV